jgi:hypothetical protein
MAATIFIEQDHGTWTGTLHRHNGYSSGFSAPRSQVLQTGQRLAPALRERDDHYYTRKGW